MKEGSIADRHDGMFFSEKSPNSIIQSGFNESKQSHVLDWIVNLSEKHGLINYGVAIKGGVEGIRMMPAPLINKLASPVQLPKFVAFIMKILSPTGIFNFYWNMKLKKHGAWERRFKID